MTSGQVPAIMPAEALGAIDAAAEALSAGGIVGLPTETVYGLTVLPRTESLAALIKAKRRPEEKGIALMVDSVDQVVSLAAVPELAHRLVDRFWPGPLTLVLPAREDVVLPDLLYGPGGTLAFRMPDHPTPRALAARLGAMALTSANVSGEIDCRTAADLVSSIGHALALVLDGGRSSGGVPSTVVGFDGEGRPVVLRPGPLDAGVLRDVAGDLG